MKFHQLDQQMVKSGLHDISTVITETKLIQMFVVVLQDGVCSSDDETHSILELSQYPTDTC